MHDDKVIETEVEDEPVHSQEVSREEVAALAYEYWVERGSPHGSHEEDWHRAETELRGRGSKTLSAHA